MSSRDQQRSDVDLWELNLINEKLLPYLQRLGYKYIEGNVSVPMGSRTLDADCVVYLDEKKEKPYIVVEAKYALRPEVTLLEPAVQHAFTIATALGSHVRYLLVTDGNRYQWFERGAETQSLVPAKYPPPGPHEPYQQTLLQLPLSPIAGTEQYYSLLQSVVDVLRKDGLVFGLRMGVELNRILIAKIHDEKVMSRGGQRRFRAEETTAEATASNVKELYNEAIAELGGEREVWSWSLSASTVQTVVRLLEPYALSSVSRNVRDHSFWRVFAHLLGKDEGAHTTPLPLAELLVHLADPTGSDRVIDPACGTGLLLLETFGYVNSLHDAIDNDAGRPDMKGGNLTGLEINSEVAELAATNLTLSGLSPRRIINVDSIQKRELEKAGVREESYDVVLLHPPLGQVQKNKPILRDFEIARDSPKANLEVLFIERSLQLLRQGGRLVSFVPDTLLSSPSLLHAREWILHNTTLRAIISLPPEAFMPAGHSGKASILVLEKRRPVSDREHVFVADIQSVGYDRFGEPTRENDLPHLIEAVQNFRNEGEVRPTEGAPRVWLVEISALRAERFDITSLDPEGHRMVRVLSHGKFPAVKLGQVADVISGRNFKDYVERGGEGVLLIQAGSVKELEIDIPDNAPRVPISDYESAKRARVVKGDVLVTTTGQYLGRAAVVEGIEEPAVASGAVTILRPRPDVSSFFLAAVVNSVIGKEQIKALQAAATAQPYLRRSDLSEVIVPLPPLDKQRELAAQISERLSQAKDLRRRADELEGRAKALIETEFLGDDVNE
jgi:type I restriction enzyme M protein